MQLLESNPGKSAHANIYDYLLCKEYDMASCMFKQLVSWIC